LRRRARRGLAERHRVAQPLREGHPKVFWKWDWAARCRVDDHERRAGDRIDDRTVRLAELVAEVDARAADTSDPEPHGEGLGAVVEGRPVLDAVAGDEAVAALGEEVEDPEGRVDAFGRLLSERRREDREAGVFEVAHEEDVVDMPI